MQILEKTHKKNKTHNNKMISHISLIQVMFRKLWHSLVICKANCAVFNHKRTKEWFLKEKVEST